MFATIKRLISDCLTGPNGDFDPARVVGYGITMAGGVEFLVLTAYTTLRTGAFDGAQFAIGLTGVGGALAASAAGVWLKKSTEVPPKEGA
ncbi:MAG: hypothetical protein AAFO57_00155 [Pseudomonadota bacterium]